MTWIPMQLKPSKCIVGKWAGIVISILGKNGILRLNGWIWLPFLFDFWTRDMSSNIVGAWSWYFITVVLASICKIGLLANRFELIFLLWPWHGDIVMICRRRVQFFLTFIDKIKVGLLRSPFRLKICLFEPYRLSISCIYIDRWLLAGPGEQLSLVDWSR